MRVRILLSTLVLVLTAPAAARAAAVSVGGKDQTVVVVDAAPGEANRVVVRFEAERVFVTVTDTGAPLAPQGPGCVAVDANTARCVAQNGLAPFLDDATADLGDGDDTFEVQELRGGVAVAVAGGPGDDRIAGGAFDDRLDGGGGTDTIAGGDGNDTIADADTDADAGPDVLDGGEGAADTLDYAGRTGPVVADLGGERAGAGGTEDQATGFENAIGGGGDDRLVGTSVLNEFTGGAGDDVLLGRGGIDRGDGFDLGDTLVAGAGDDRVVGGDGPETLSPGAGRDRVGCGGEDDTVLGAQRGETLASTCETVEYGFGEFPREDRMRIPVRPAAIGTSSVTWRVACPGREELDGEAPGCRGRFTVREEGGRGRLLARGTIRGRNFVERRSETTRLRLTPLGAQLARRGVRATARIRGADVAKATWTFRFGG